MDLSAAATNHAAAEKERSSLKAEAKLNLWQSDTSHLIQDCLFRVTLHFFFFLPPSVFFFLPPSSLSGKLARPLFSLPVSFLFIFLKKKLRQECLRLLPRERKPKAVILPGSKRAQNDMNQSLSKSLEGRFFFYIYIFFCCSGDAVMPHL